MNDLRKTQESFARKAQAEPAHRFRDLYHLICREEWLAAALYTVLQGCGVSARQFAAPDAQARLVRELRTELKEGTYRPQFAERQCAAARGGRRRTVGAGAVKDRVVQTALKMLMEPIWESDFLDCSNGFRPGRGPMDCIRTCYARITTQNKYLWAAAGEIEGPFGHVQHVILLKLLRRRIADERVVSLVAQLLRAGIMGGRLFGAAEEGIPQEAPSGSILPPLLTNIYLHEFDRWWWEQYGGLTPYRKWQRRKGRQGNCVLTRCGNRFLLLWNGPHAGAVRLREEAERALWDRLHLKLSAETAPVTHITDGFDFLGFHLQWKLPRSGKPWLRVVPSAASTARLKRTVKRLTKRGTLYQLPLEKIRSLNRVLRAWNQYYAYVSAASTANKLTFWANDRLFLWLRKRHHKGAAWVIRTYRRREQTCAHDRWNLGTRDSRGDMVFLYQMCDLHRTPYCPRRRPHPFLSAAPAAPAAPDMPTTPFPAFWSGRTTPQKADWAAARLSVLQRDQYKCCRCGGGDKLRVCRVRPQRRYDEDQMSSLQTLCRRCRARAPKQAGAGAQCGVRQSWKAG